LTRARPDGDNLRDRTFARILLIKPSSLGDIVHALPVLHGLRRRYPNAAIDWLVNSGFASLLRDHPEIDEVIPFDRRRFGRMVNSPRAAAAFARFVRDLRARRYDLVVDLQGLFRTGFLAWASGARVRIGPRPAREAAGWFYSHRLPRVDEDVHAVDRSYELARLLGFEDVPITFALPVGAETAALVDQRLSADGPSDRSVVLVAPGARWETKVWPVEGFVELIGALRDETGATCVLVGADADAARCGAIERGCRDRPVNLAGRTSLTELAAWVRRADVVVCHDSATAHLAAAYDRPLVCITGPTNPRRTGPYRREADVIRLKLDCSPCYLRRLSQCRHDHRCMCELSSRVVAEAVVQRLRRGDPAVIAGAASGDSSRRSRQ
jgi:heptosyltransferase-2